MVVSLFERVHLLEPCRGVSPSLSLTAGSDEPDGGTGSGRYLRCGPRLSGCRWFCSNRGTTVFIVFCEVFVSFSNSNPL